MNDYGLDGPGSNYTTICMLLVHARIGVNKSRAIALGSSNKSTPIMDIKYYDDIALLGIHMTTNIKESATKSWAMLAANIRAQVQETYHRALILGTQNTF